MQNAGSLTGMLMAILGARMSEQQAAALCMLGSLQDIASCSTGDILEHTDVSPAQCALPPNP